MSEDTGRDTAREHRGVLEEALRFELPALVRLLRPWQWSKNLLVFAAAVFANQIFSAAAAGRATLAFLAFCLASSSVYAINDVLDAEVDRQHPVKRTRPIAAGAIAKRTALLIAVLLTIGAFAISAWINPAFVVAIAIYIALVHFYTIVGKHVVIFDVMLVAAGFVLRAVGGAIAIGVPSSDWFVLCTFFAALFLALSKRRAEMLASEEGSGGHRAVIGQYTEPTLAAFATTAIAATAITYSLYAIDATNRFRWLPLTIPFVLFAVFRYHHLVETSQIGERPEEAFGRDRPFRLCVLCYVAVALAAIYLEV